MSNCKECDNCYEAEEMKQAAIDTEVESYMKDDDIVEKLIEDNSDVIWSVIKSGKDVQERLIPTIEHFAYCLAEENLK